MWYYEPENEYKRNKKYMIGGLEMKYFNDFRYKNGDEKELTL